MRARNRCLAASVCLGLGACSEATIFIESVPGARTALWVAWQDDALRGAIFPIGPGAGSLAVTEPFEVEQGARISTLFYEETPQQLLLAPGALVVVSDPIAGRLWPSPWLDARCGVLEEGAFQRSDCGPHAELEQLRLPRAKAEDCLGVGGCVRGSEADLRCEIPCLTAVVSAPRAPEAAELPELADCPACPADQAPFLAGCRAPAEACVDPVDVSPWSPARVIQVPAGSSLALAASAPDDAVLVLESGSYTGLAELKPGQSLIGPCPARTVVRGASRLVLFGAGRDNLVRGVRLEAVTLALEAGARLELDGVWLAGTGATLGIDAQASTLVVRDSVIDGFVRNVSLSQGAQADLDQVVIRGGVASVAVNGAVTRAHIARTNLAGSEHGVLVTGGSAALDRVLISDTTMYGIQLLSGSLDARDVLIDGAIGVGVWAQRSSVQLARVTIDSGRRIRLHLDEVDGALRDVILRGDPGQGSLDPSGLYARGSTLRVERMHVRGVDAIGVQLDQGSVTASDLTVQDTGGRGLVSRGPHSIARVSVRRAVTGAVTFYGPPGDAIATDLELGEVEIGTPESEGVLDVDGDRVRLERVRIAAQSDGFGLRVGSCGSAMVEDADIRGAGRGLEVESGVASLQCTESLEATRVRIADSFDADVHADPGSIVLAHVQTGSLTLARSAVGLRLSGGAIQATDFVIRHRDVGLEIAKSEGLRDTLLQRGRFEDCGVLLRSPIDGLPILSTLTPLFSAVAADCARVRDD